MPELPEVQTTVNGLNELLAESAKGLSVVDVWTDYDSKHHAGKDNIKDPAFFKKFRRAVVGARIDSASRRGKNVLVHLSSGVTVIIHMKMTGHVMYGAYRKLPKKDAQGESWRPADPKDEALNDPFNRFVHLVFSLSDGKHLVLSDMRKFAKVTFAETAKLHESPHVSEIGPEPLDPSFDAAQLRERAMRRPNGFIKQVLMDHTVVAGIGNIYSDEILWRVGTHPLERVKDVKDKKWPEIFKATLETLRRGIDFGGDSMSDYRDIRGKRGSFQGQHQAYRRTGERCTKRGCTGTIRRIKVGGRSGHYCDVHQKLSAHV